MLGDSKWDSTATDRHLADEERIASFVSTSRMKGLSADALSLITLPTNTQLSIAYTFLNPVKASRASQIYMEESCAVFER